MVCVLDVGAVEWMLYYMMCVTSEGRSEVLSHDWRVVGVFCFVSFVQCCKDDAMRVGCC